MLNKPEAMALEALKKMVKKVVVFKKPNIPVTRNTNTRALHKQISKCWWNICCAVNIIHWNLCQTNYKLRSTIPMTTFWKGNAAKCECMIRLSVCFIHFVVAFSMNMNGNGGSRREILGPMGRRSLQSGAVVLDVQLSVLVSMKVRKVMLR